MPRNVGIPNAEMYRPELLYYSIQTVSTAVGMDGRGMWPNDNDTGLEARHEPSENEHHVTSPCEQTCDAMNVQADWSRASGLTCATIAARAELSLYTISPALGKGQSTLNFRLAAQNGAQRHLSPGTYPPPRIEHSHRRLSVPAPNQQHELENTPVMGKWQK